MKISWIKYKKDKENFLIPKRLGMEVIELEDLEQTDESIQTLIQKNYRTIIVSNEVASFSEDIIKKHAFSNEITILIAPVKNQKEY